MEEERFEEFEKEKKSLKVKYTFLIIIISILAAVAASEFTLYYYTKDGLINKGELFSLLGINCLNVGDIRVAAIPIIPSVIKVSAKV